jgi:hypothetical protein
LLSPILPPLPPTPGHDHEPYLETINGCTIIKTGADAKNIGICELYWPDALWVGNKPQTSVLMKSASDFAPDLLLTATVATHKSILKELDRSVLCPIPAGLAFSSAGIRLRPSTVGTFVCTTLREELGTELCLCGSGSIRGSRNYAGMPLVVTRCGSFCCGRYACSWP